MAVDSRVTQAASLALAELDADARVTQVAILALEGPPAVGAQVTQATALALVEYPVEARVTQTVVLALAKVSSRNNASGIPTEPGCATRSIQCWRIERTDGTVLRFTTHDNPVTFRGQTFQPCASLRASASAQGSASGLESGDIQATGLIDDDAISARDLAAGLYDGATVEVWAVDWGTGQLIRRVSKGVVSAVEQGDAGYTMTILTPGARLSQQPILPTFAPACRWALGDSRCGVDVDALKETGAVGGLDPRNAATQARYRRWTDASLVSVDGFFDLGTVVWLTGDNAGLRSQVKTYAAGVVQLWDLLPNEIQLGDTYDIFPGCDKRKATCLAKFSNLVNFGGFPDIPGIDVITKTPNAKA